MTEYNASQGSLQPTPKISYYKILLFFLLMLFLYGYFRFEMISQEIMNFKKAEKINIFVLAGQSNMAGRGGVSNGVWDKYTPIECTSNAKILRLNNDLKLEEAKEPLHAGIDDVQKICGVGPGMAFANTILKKDPRFGVIVLVPCAYGGSNITDWSMPNSWVRSRLIARANEALKHGGEIRAILWYQGETDTRSKDTAKKFRGKYEKFLHLLYQELNNPKAPFIQVALASGQGVKNYMHSVRKSQKAMKDVITVDAFGLQLAGDGMHLTTAAQVQLGKMLANAYLNSTN